MQIPNVGLHAHHRLAINLQKQTQHAVSRGMLRSHVEDHGLVGSFFETSDPVET